MAVVNKRLLWTIKEAGRDAAKRHMKAQQRGASQASTSLQDTSTGVVYEAEHSTPYIESSVAGPYRCFFNAYPFFNRIQSCVMDDVLHSDKPVVVSAPTGSGKTAILELALVRLLSAATHTGEHGRRPRAVYGRCIRAAPESL
ncbi:hypothetical protein MRX96_028047 [Rhipicephalus microplus]